MNKEMIDKLFIDDETGESRYPTLKSKFRKFMGDERMEFLRNLIDQEIMPAAMKALGKGKSSATQGIAIISSIIKDLCEKEVE